MTAWGEALSRVLNSSSLPCRNVRRGFYLINTVKTTLPCLCLTGTLWYKYLVRFARALTAGLGLVLRVRWGYKPGACRRGGAEVRSDGPEERRAGQSWRGGSLSVWFIGRSSATFQLKTRLNSRRDRMEDTGEAQEELKLVSSDSAYGGSSAVDTDTEDGQTPTAFPYNEDITHKVMT